MSSGRQATASRRVATARTEVLDLHTVYFLTGRAALGPLGRAAMTRASRVLELHPALRLELDGHADSTGSRAFNVMLAKQRAVAVRELLVGLGIAPDRLVAVGHGPDQPAASNATRAGRAQNRRVELRALD